MPDMGPVWRENESSATLVSNNTTAVWVFESGFGGFAVFGRNSDLTTRCIGR